MILKKHLLLTLFALLSLLGRSQESGVSEFNHLPPSPRAFKKLNYYRRNGSLDSALFYNDKLLEMADGNYKKIPTLIFQKMNTYLSFNKTAEAYKLGVVSIEQYCGKEYDNCKGCSYIYRRLSDIMEMMHDYEEGIRLLESDCGREGRAIWYYQKAILQSKLGDVKGAMSTTQSFINDNQGRYGRLVEGYNNHGLVARSNADFITAIEAFEKAIELIDKKGVRTGLKPTILGNIGACYFDLKNYERAYENLLKDSEGSIKTKQWGSYINAEVNLAEIEQVWGQDTEAVERLITLLNDYDDQMIFSQKTKSYALLIQSLRKTNNANLYSVYSKKHIDLIESQYNSEVDENRELIKAHSQNAVTLIKDQMKSERELMDKEVEILKQKDAANALFNWLLSSSLILSLIIVALLFLRYRSNQKKKSLLQEAQLNLSKKEQELLSLKVKEEAQNVRELSLELTVKNDFAQNLSKELTKLDGLHTSDRNRIEMFVQSEMDIKSTRAQLQDIMGDDGSKFHSDLKLKHPNLTDNEIRLAVMVVLKMTNKEIAIKRNITPGSVKMAKNRLKKKMEVDNDVRLFSYLEQLIKSD